MHHGTDDFGSEAVALSRQVTRNEQNVFCFPGTFFAHANLQSLRLYPFTDGWHPFVVAAEVIYLLFLLYYMIVQVRGRLGLPGLEVAVRLSRLTHLPWNEASGRERERFCLPVCHGNFPVLL